MLIDVVKVKALKDYRLRLTFADGVEGIVDFAKLTPFDGVYEPLKDPVYFAKVRVRPEFGVIVWPNDADCDSEVLYYHVTGIKDWEEEDGRERAGHMLRGVQGKGKVSGAKIQHKNVANVQR